MPAQRRIGKIGSTILKTLSTRKWLNSKKQYMENYQRRLQIVAFHALLSRPKLLAPLRISALLIISAAPNNSLIKVSSDSFQKRRIEAKERATFNGTVLKERFNLFHLDSVKSVGPSRPRYFLIKGTAIINGDCSCTLISRLRTSPIPVLTGGVWLVVHL